MIHYSCDLCGRSMGQEHFVAKIKVAPAFDPEQLTEEELDVDHLEQIADAITAMETTGDFQPDECLERDFQFELCPTCYSKFIKAPLGPARPAVRLNYSQN